LRRAIARRQTLWVRLFVLAIVTNVLVPVPRPFDLALIAAPFALFLVRPRVTDRIAVELAAPVRGRWVALNSPGSTVPSHGVKAYGQMYAVDLLQPSQDAAASIGWSLRGRPAESYPSFGEPILAMAPGTVVHVQDSQSDHRARNTWPLLLWMLTAEGFLRELSGASRILGNHVIVQHDDGVFAAYAHLRRSSARVRVGQHVHAGQQLAQVGNTGNTSEPHLHVQLMDRAHPTAAAGVAMHWPDLVIDPAERDPRWARGKPKPSAQPGFPANGQVFVA
jgi:hypothetical protein